MMLTATGGGTECRPPPEPPKPDPAPSTSRPARKTATTAGTVGSRGSRTGARTAVRTRYHHRTPLTTPAAAAAGTAKPSGTRQTSAPATVNTTKFSSARATSRAGGSPRHQPRQIPPRCTNGANSSSGTSSPRTNQDSETATAAMAIVAPGETITAQIAAKPRFAPISRRTGGRGTSTGQASAMAAAPNSPRYPTAAANSATNPGQLSWYTKVHSMSCSEPYGAGALASTDNPSDGRKWRA